MCQADRIETFMKAHPWPAADKSIRSCLENIRIAAMRIQRDAGPMHAWLESYFQKTA